MEPADGATLHPEIPAEFAAPLTSPDADLQAVLRDQIEQAVLFVDGELSPARTRLARYYEGELPDLPAPEGRSQAVATVVRDTIIAMKPGLLRAFFGPEQVVEFRARKAEDEDQARQQSAYINYILTEDNPGFVLLEAAIEDALVKDFGIVKWWWEDQTTTEGVIYEHLTLPELESLLASDPQITLESIEPNQLGGLKVAVTRVRVDGRARVAAVPPEEFLFTRSARALEDAPFVAHRRLATVSDLVAMGYDRQVVEDAVSAGESVLDNEEATQRAEWDRNAFSWDSGDDTPANPAMRRVKYVEAYLRFDQDGDGIAELRRVCTIGDAYTIVHNTPVAERPFALFLADPKPHTLQGRGMARRVDDLQAIQSAILRATLDSLNLSIVQKTEVVEGMVNLKDVLNPELASVVRVKAPGMMREVKHSFVGSDTMPMMEWVEEQRENRTGTSRASAGLNPDALQSSTKAAVAATVTASQQQAELVARNLAETGFKPLMRGLYRLVKRHQSEARLVQLFGEYVPVDPSAWAEPDPDVSVNVALGMGLAEERIAALTAIGMDQKEVLATLGPQNPVVTLKQYRDTLAKKVALAGWKNVEQFYQPVDPNWQPPPQEPQVDPAAQQLAQIEMAKVQGQQAIAEQRLAFDREKAQQDFLLEQEKLRLEDARARDEMLLRMETERFKVEAQTQTQIDTARLQAAAKSPEAG